MERNSNQDQNVIDTIANYFYILINENFTEIEISKDIRSDLKSNELLNNEELLEIYQKLNNGNYVENLEKAKKLNWLINRLGFIFLDRSNNLENKIKNEIVFDKEKKEIILKRDIYNSNYNKKDDIVVNYKDFFTDEIFSNMMNNLINTKPPENNNSQEDINYLTIIATIIKFFRGIDGSNKQITVDDLIIYFNSRKVTLDFSKDIELVKAFILAGDTEIVKYFENNNINITTIPNVDKFVFASGNPELVNYYEEELGLYNRPEYKMIATYNALEGACMSNNPNIVGYLFDNYNINQINNKNSLIKVFSIIRDPRIAFKVLDRLRELGYNIKDKDDNGKTIFKYAIENNNLEVVQFLLIKLVKEYKNKSFPEDIKEMMGQSGILACFLKNNNKEMLKLLFENNLDTKDELIKAFSIVKDSNEASEILERFMNLNYDINEKDSKGKSILYYAIKNNNFDAIVSLFSKEDITIDNNLIPFAAKKGNVKAIKLLLEKKSEVLSEKEMEKLINEKYDRKNSILHLAIENDNIELVELLLEQPWIDVNLRDNYYDKYSATYDNGKTPLFLAVEKENTRIVELLLNHPKINANATLRTINKRYISYYRDKVIEKSLLNFAIEKGNLEIIKLLVGYENTDVNKGDRMHTTLGDRSIFDKEEIAPINLAAKHGYIEVVKLLLSNPKIDINAKYIVEHPETYCESEYRDEFYEEGTPICFAIKNGNSEMVRLLLSKSNIDLTAKYIHNETIRIFRVNGRKIRTNDTAIHMAMEVENPDIIEPILNYIKEQDIIFSKEEKDNLIFRIINDLRYDKDKSKYYNVLKCYINNEIISVNDIDNYYKENTDSHEDLYKEALLRAFYENKDFEMFEYFLESDEWKYDIFNIIIYLTDDIYSSNDPELIQRMEGYRDSLDLPKEYKEKCINDKLKTINGTAKNLAESIANDNILSNGEEIVSGLPDSENKEIELNK